MGQRSFMYCTYLIEFGFDTQQLNTYYHQKLSIPSILHPFTIQVRILRTKFHSTMKLTSKIAMYCRSSL